MTQPKEEQSNSLEKEEQQVATLLNSLPPVPSQPPIDWRDEVEALIATYSCDSGGNDENEQGYGVSDAPILEPEKPIIFSTVALESVEPWPEYMQTLLCMKKMGHIDALRKQLATCVEELAELSLSQEHMPVFRSDPEINKRVSLFAGDITRLQVDAIVNSTGRDLPGGGLSWRIFEVAGPQMLEECLAKAPHDFPHLPSSVGKVVLTHGFNLPSKFVMHVVGPIGEDPENLALCYNTCLRTAMEEPDVRTIAFPCISTGVFGYPAVPAAHVALRCVRSFLEDSTHREKVERIVFDVKLPRDQEIYEQLMLHYFPIASDSGPSN
jgi:O-acetyl-ADP-ribose deacetylase (regulator of RNase III)